MYTLPDLTYDYASLAPHISPELMHLHHDKHHKAYVDKLNAALEKAPEQSSKPLEELLAGVGKLPDGGIKTAIINFGGGHYNHGFFWQSMSPVGGGEPKGELHGLILDKYGTFESFVEGFTSTAMGVFGSGWVWLQSNGDIITTQNQVCPLSFRDDKPILCLDVWEHAYYPDYQNRRDEYIRAWWNLVNWNFAEAQFEASKI